MTIANPNDRKAVTSTGYEPRFDIDLGQGKDGERLVEGIYTDLFAGRVEVKKDRKGWKTGNHYVETAQRSSDGKWRASGINTTMADWWAIVGPDEEGMLVISVNRLRELALAAEESEQPIANSRTNATKGRLVKVADIVAVVMHDTFSP